MTKRRPIAIVSNDREVVDLIDDCAGYDLIGVIDRNPAANTGGLPILGSDDRWQALLEEHPRLRVALVVDSPRLKAKLLSHYGIEALETIVSPHSYVAPSVELAPGCVIQRGATILPGAQLGLACKVNINATVHHDSLVGDCCTLAPGCILLGNTDLGDEVFVGAGAIVLPRVRIENGARIGAGAVVTADVASNSTVVGVPAGLLQKRPS